MKKRALIVLGLVLMLTAKQEVKADEIKLFHTWATAYDLKGLTKTETVPTEGRTVAAKEEWLGSTMILWTDDGDGIVKPENYLGTYVVEDTGGATIQSGEVIDVYIPDHNRAIEFGSKKVMFQIVKAEG